MQSATLKKKKTHRQCEEKRERKRRCSLLQVAARATAAFCIAQWIKESEGATVEIVSFFFLSRFLASFDADFAALLSLFQLTTEV